MKFFKIEIQVTLLTIIIAAAVVGSGYLVYQSLSQIVNSIHQEARPDFKLLLIKDIASELTEAENTIRLFSLTNDEELIFSYAQLNSSIQENLINLKDYSIPGSEEIVLIDSIQLLSNRKLMILDEIQTLYKSKDQTVDRFTDLYSKIDTVIIQPDTITFQPEERPGFFGRLFGKKDTTIREPIIIDKTPEKEIIKQEIAEIEQQMSDRSSKFQATERVLLERDIQVTALISQQIAVLENNEQRRLETKTEEADFLAAQTYRRLAIFTIASVILLIIILIIFFRNLQRNRAYQNILTKAKYEAESLAKAKERFVATVSHEMRTPVNAIFGLTEQMMQKESSEEIKANLNVVHKSAEHLITLVNDTLDFSKIESQQMKIEHFDFFLNEVLNEVYTLHKQTAEAKAIQLVINNQTDNDLVLEGDPIRLKQILINLVTNAIKFTSQGYVIINIEKKENTQHNCILNFEVSDTGAGIPTKNLNNIFDEFVQLDTDQNQKHRGAGLGLAIVKKLVDLQGGSIKVDSIPGKGSTFSIQIPYKKGNAENIKDKVFSSIEVPSYFRDLHFLLVDDEEFNRYLLVNILKKWGVSYTEASNGQQAVELAFHNQFDLILMDMRMPVLNGLDAAKEIINSQPDAKIIALTATNKAEDKQKCQQAGMLGFLQKPFTESEIFQAIMEQISSNSKNEHETTTDPLINLNELQRMAGGDNSFFNEMLELFVNSSEKGLITIQKGLQDNDWEAIYEAAHKLAAPAKHMMATPLYQQLKLLENKMTSNPDPDELKGLVNSIEQKIHQINQFIKQKLNER